MTLITHNIHYYRYQTRMVKANKLQVDNEIFTNTPLRQALIQ